MKSVNSKRLSEKRVFLTTGVKMAHKASPRRTGEMKKQVVPWSYKIVMKVPKKAKGTQKQEVVIHSPPAW